MNQPMKIIIAGGHEFPEGGGGAPRCIRMLAKGFASQGHVVTVLTTYGSWEGKCDIEIDGFYARSFGNNMLRGKGLRAKYDWIKAHLLLCFHLLRLTFEKEYDLLLFYGPVLQFPITGILANVMKRKTAYLMADVQPQYSKMSLGITIKCAVADFVDFLLARLSHVIVVLGTSALQERYLRLAPKTKQIRIWAPTDTQIFNTGDGERIKHRYGLHGRKVVSYAGALDTLEGVHLLIAAIQLVAKKHSEVVLVLAGNESKTDRVVGEKVDFRRIAREAGIGKRVVFTGHLSQNEVIDLLAASDVLVMPKIDHPMNHVASPIKIAEYLAAGRPVVSSNICEMDVILQHMENVLFCKPGNVEELAESIERVLNDAALQRKLAENATKVARLIFDYRACTKRILAEIND